MRNKVFFGGLIILFFAIKIQAQQKISLESMVPPAPHAAELGKYGTYPVGTLTGIPEISFPLYEIISGKLKLPISLSYHASGIQANQKSTDIGLGWSIMAGGTISRTVYGSADDSYYGYFNYTLPSYSALMGITNFYTMQQYSNTGYDLEPDLFVYNIGGKSGKFICTKNKNFLTIPFDPIKINKMVDGQNKAYFRIVDDNGNIYQFDRYSNTISDFSIQRNTVSSWYLTSMISADFTDTIGFVYETVFSEDPVEHQTWMAGKVYSAGSPSGFFQGGLEKIQSVTTYNELLIKQVNFKNGYVQFNRNTFRKDVNPVSNSLDEMLVYSVVGQLVKKVTFNHNYFLTTPFLDNWAHYRLKLTGFIESDPGMIIKKEYKFEYDDASLPQYGSYDIDYWGFHNGAGNQGLIPETTVYAVEINGVSFANGESYTNGFTNPNESFTIGNANREPSATHMKSGILKKITYPTGGYTQFEFEPHRYLSDEYIKQPFSTSGSTYGINKFNKSVSTYSFSFPSSPALVGVNGVYINANLNINFSASNMGNTEMGETQYVTLTNLTTNTIIKTWKHESDLMVPLNVSETILLFSGQSYELKNEVYGDGAVFVNSSISWSENTDQHPVKIGGGLRITSVKNYSMDNILAKVETYLYGTAANGLGVKLFDERNFYRNYEDIVLDYWKKNPHLCGRDATVWQRNFFGISKYNSLNYLGSPILYSTVVKYEGGTTVNAGKTIYNYNILPDQINFPAEFINSGNYGAINNAWHQGELTNETIFKKAGIAFIPVSRTEYEYTKFNLAVEKGIQIKQYKQFVKMDDCATYPEGPDIGNFKPGQGFFSIYEYPIKTGANRKTKETKIVYDQANGLSSISTVTTTQYQNPNNLYPTELITEESGGSKKITRLKYPQDMPDPVSLAMVSKNILTPTLEEKIYKSVFGAEALLYTTQTSYKQIGNLIEQDNIKLSAGSVAPETRIQFNQYDMNGNIVEQQKANDTKEVYLWGYKSQYVVAKIVGTDYNTARQYVNQSLLDNPSTTEQDMRAELDKLRINLPGALVTTFTYKPLVGMLSETNPNGKILNYEYDSFNRLKLIRNHENNILKRICYNYAGQQENCASHVYSNIAKTASFPRNNCGSGTLGSPVNYTVAANTYSSTVSQADADQMAQNDINDNGQHFANENGDCTSSLSKVTGYNYQSISYKASFANISTGQYYSMNLNPQSGASLQLPGGFYSVNISGPKFPVNAYFEINGYSTYGTSAFFLGVNMGISNYLLVRAFGF